MPRLTSTAKGGFYPFQTDHLPAVASLFKPPGAKSLILDPCAGDGVPLEQLADMLNLSPYANELDLERAALCTDRFGPLHSVQGDLLTLRTPHNAYSLIWLNPPYTENVSQSGAAETRREFEYLKHAWKWAQHGGYVCWAVYHHHLTRRAIRFLLENSRRVDVYRMPSLHLGAYRQVVVVAQKSLKKRDPEPAEIERRLILYREGIDDDVPELAVAAAPRYALPEPPDLRKFYFRPDSHAPAQMLAAIREHGAQLHHTFQDITRPEPPAPPLTPVVRPRGGQIGLILAAGIFDGLILDLDYGPAAVRGVTRQVEIETTPEHLKGVRETFETRPVVTVSLLYKDGRLEILDGDDQTALIAFLTDHREALLHYIDEQTTPLYTFDYGHLEPIFANVFRQRQLPGRPTTGLFETQKHVVGAAYAALQHRPGVLISGEMGVGKTAIGATLAGALYALGDVAAGKVCVVMCPPHLTRKWEAEFVDAVPGTVTEIVKRPEEVSAFMARAARAPERLHVMVLSENAAKLSEGIAPAAFTKTEYEVRWPVGSEPPGEVSADERVVTRHTLLCPTCSAPLTKDKAGQTAATASWLAAEPRFCHRCGGALWQYKRNPTWSGPRPGEKFLRKPPRYPIASLLAEQYPDRVGVVLVDEVHENKNAGVGRGEAMQRLVALADKSVGMTGTLFGGTASTVFWLEWAFNPAMYRLFPIGDTGRERGATLSLWSRTMGVMERVVEYKEVSAGSYTQVKPFEYQPREVPGITPRLVAQLLDHTIWVSLSDMAFDLPHYEEIPVPVELPAEVQTDYDRAKRVMLDYIQQLRLEGDNTFTSSYLYAALRYPSACFRQKVVTHTPKELKKAYRKRGQTAPERVVVTMKGWGADRVYPKEQELVDIVRRELNANRRVLVYVEQTGTLDIQPRLADLVAEQVAGARPLILTTTSNASTARSKRGVPTGKPDTDKRDAWVRKQVEAGCNVLLCNPRLVSTGLDLIDFHTIVVYETPYSLYTLSQASRRTWRIGQTRDCRVYYLYYRSTMEEQAISLVSKKQAAAALLGGDAEGGGLAQLSAGGSLSLEAELARLIAEDEQIVDASQLFRENARRSLDFTSGWASRRTSPPPEAVKGESIMPDPEPSQREAVESLPALPAPPAGPDEVRPEYRAAKAKHPDVLVLVRLGEMLVTYEADAELLAEHAARLEGVDCMRSGCAAHVPAEAAQVVIRALNRAGLRVAVVKARPREIEAHPAGGAIDTTRINASQPEHSEAPAAWERTPRGRNVRKAPASIPGITPAHPHADLFNKSFYDAEHRLTTVTGPDAIFPETHLAVRRTLPDGSRRTYSLPADKARRYYAADPVDTPEASPPETQRVIPGLTASTEGSGQQVIESPEATLLVEAGVTAADPIIAEPDEAAATEPAAARPLRVGDTFTYEGRTYQLHSVTPESEFYPEGELRADDLSGGVPIRRVFSSLMHFEQSTGRQVERPVADKTSTAPALVEQPEDVTSPTDSEMAVEQADDDLPEFPPEVQWLVERAAPQIDLDHQYALIPGSGTFEGRLPHHMIRALRAFLDERGASVCDGGEQTIRTWRVGERSYSLNFGATPSTAHSVRFTFTPDSWQLPDQPERSDVPYTLRYEGEWTWLAFAARPVHEVTRERLKSLGFRWSRKRRAQYADRRISPDVVAEVLGYPAEDITHAGQVVARQGEEAAAQQEQAGMGADVSAGQAMPRQLVEASSLEDGPGTECLTLPTAASLEGRVVGELIDTDGSSVLLYIEAIPGQKNRYRIAATEGEGIPAFPTFGGHAQLSAVLSVLQPIARQNQRCLEPVDPDSALSHRADVATGQERGDAHALPTTDEAAFAVYRRVKRSHPTPLVFVEASDGLVTYLDDARTVAELLTLPLTRLPVDGHPLTPKASIRKQTGEAYLTRLREKHAVALSGGRVRVLPALDGPLTAASFEETARDLTR